MGGNTNQTNGGSAGEVHLKRNLSLPMVIMFGLAYLAPTVVFNYYGVVTTNTNGMMTLAYIMTTVVMFFSAWSYARMAEVFPKAGSAYTYVQSSIGPRVGFIAGWLVLLDYLLLPMESYLLIGIYVHKYFPVIPVWLALLVVITIAAIINIVGMKTAATVDTVIVAAEIGFSVLFVIVVIRHVLNGGGSGTLVDASALYNAGEFSISNVLASSAMLCVAFLGFDAVTTMSEEVKNPRKTIPRAIMFVAVGAGIMFAVISYFTQIGWPTGYLNIVDADSGIFELLDNIGAGFMGDLFFIIDNLASFVCAMAALSAVSRVMYSMGRDNVLPKKVFGRLNPKFRTPVINIIIACGVAMMAVFFQDNLEGALSLVSFGAISGFVMVNLSVIIYFVIKQKKRDPKSLVKFGLMPAVGLVVSIVLWIGIDSHAKMLGLVWLAAGIVYLGVTTRGFRELPPEMHMDEDYDPDEEEDGESLPDEPDEPAEEPADEDGEFIGDPVLEFSGK